MSAVVLLSSGLDSTVNLYATKNEMPVKLALTFNYGQKASQKEIERSAQICKQAQVSHQVIELPWFKDFTKTSLVNANAEVPVQDNVSIDDIQQSEKTAEKVWVPNRNGIFLNIAAAFAESLNAKYVVPGFNAEEAMTFSDNTPEFLSAMTTSLSFSTANQVKAKCFTSGMNKTVMVSFAKQLQVPMDLIWSCYFSGDEMCGQCESCQRFFRAVKGA